MTSLVKARLEWLERMAADTNLHSTAVRVALVISSYLNQDSGKAWPSIKTIAAASGTPERTVKRVIGELCDAGYLEKRRGGFSKSNVYVMAGTATVDGNETPVSTEAMGGPNDGHSEAMCGPNESSIEAMGGPSVGPWVAPRSGHGWPTNSLIEPIIEPFKEEYISSPPPSCASPSKVKGALEDGFEAFFAAYPRKASKGQARKAWGKAIKLADPATLIAAARRYASERRNEDPRFTKLPASWLNAEAWLDEPPPKAPPSQSSPTFVSRNTAKERTAAAIQHMLETDIGEFP